MVEAIYRGRTHAIGTLSFGAACELENVARLVSTFVRAFCPRDGLRVRVSRGARCEVLPNRFTQTASISAAQLARGGSVELTEGDFDAPQRPLFWVESRSSEEESAVRLSFGWCIARPGAKPAELAVSEAMSTMIEAAAEAKDCVSALVTAQGKPLTRNDSALPYESLAGVPRERSTDATWLRAHVRSPAWMFLVPAAAARALSRKAPPEVSCQRTRSGSLVRVDAPTPFVMSTTEALETWLRPALGT